MKKKIKEFTKSYLIGLILGIVVSGTISVIAATYFPSNIVRVVFQVQMYRALLMNYMVCVPHHQQQEIVYWIIQI